MHELDSTNGIYSFASAREHGWHKLGQVLPDVMTAQQALAAAYLANWNVRLVPEYAHIPAEITADGVTPPMDIETGKFSSIRTNPITGLAEVLGSGLGAKYTVIQNEDQTDMLDQLVDESGAKYETAGAVRGGRQTFVSMKMPRSMNVVLPDGTVDTTSLYLISLNSHDLSMAHKILIAPVRVQCANTQALALSTAKASFSIRHTANAKGRALEVRKALGMTFDYAEVFESEMQRLVARDVEDREAERLLRESFAAVDAEPEDAFSTRKENQINDVMHLFRMSSTIPDSIRGTRYGLYNAVTEWADHFQSVQGSDPALRRAERIANGNSGKLKAKMFAALAR